MELLLGLILVAFMGAIAVLSCRAVYINLCLQDLRDDANKK